MKGILTWAVLTSCFTPLLVSAAPFQDLDFEQAVIDPVQPQNDPGYIQPAAAFPGWTAAIGGQPASAVFAGRDLPLDATFVALISSSSNSIHVPPIDGAYNLELDGFAGGPSGEP